jgi:hypothetical protein
MKQKEKNDEGKGVKSKGICTKKEKETWNKEGKEGICKFSLALQMNVGRRFKA